MAQMINIHQSCSSQQDDGRLTLLSEEVGCSARDYIRDYYKFACGPPSLPPRELFVVLEKWAASFRVGDAACALLQGMDHGLVSGRVLGAALGHLYGSRAPAKHDAEDRRPFSGCCSVALACALQLTGPLQGFQLSGERGGKSAPSVDHSLDSWHQPGSPALAASCL